MTKESRSSLLQRLGVQAMRRMSKLTQGYDPIFLGEMVELLGVRGVAAWGEKLQAIAEIADERYGFFEAQLLVSFSAMFNGCRICSVGHMFGANLDHFDRTGELFPIDELEVYDLQALSDEAVLTTVDERLSDARYDEVRARIHRMFALKYGAAAAENDDDEVLLGLIAVWELLSECTIVTSVSDPAEIDPLTPIGKRKELIARYRQARGRG